MIQTASYSNIGGRLRNEDTVRLVCPTSDSLCLVVADGLGGHGGGAQASAAAADTVCGGFPGQVSEEMLKSLVQQAHSRVQEMQSERCAMKTTIVVLTICGREAVWAHVGDSRLYHFQDGIKDFQTRDHSASQIAVALGDITVDQIRFHEDRNRVLRALGQEGSLNVETGSRILGPGRHAFLLCSDGFWEYVVEAEMEACLREASGPEDWLDKMRRLLLKRVPADNDNNTAAAVWLE